MYDDGRPFLRRAWLFFQELQKNEFANATTVAELAQCSKKTMQRTIDALRFEFNFPIEYVEGEHGWRLKDKSYTFPSLPPTKEEFAALILARNLAQVLGDASLEQHISSLWGKYAAEFPQTAIKLENLSEVFSSELTVLGRSGAFDLFTFLSYAARKQGCELVYKSPWRSGEPNTYTGRILRVHFSDGILYLLFGCDTGKQLVLNTCFVKDLAPVPYDPLEKVTLDEPDARWLDGFGIWAGTEVQDIEVRILPPAAEYYAAQQWDQTQVDSWDGNLLVRRIKAPISPEIVRRVLSLGSSVKEIKPRELKDAVQHEARALAEKLL